MSTLSEEVLYSRYPWSRPIVPEIPDAEGFYDLAAWTFNAAQLNLIDKLFAEIEDWFNSRSLPIDIAIYEIQLRFDRLDVQFLCSASEISLIIDRYKMFFGDLE